MPKKLNSSPIALVERAVLVSCANSRIPGWRQAQMKVFANRLGDYTIPEQGVDLERECARIVRALGPRYARKLLNWFVAVKKSAETQSEPAEIPFGIPKQAPGLTSQELPIETDSGRSYRHYSRHRSSQKPAQQLLM